LDNGKKIEGIGGANNIGLEGLRGNNNTTKNDYRTHNNSLEDLNNWRRDRNKYKKGL